MSAHRYWRLISPAPWGRGTLELSEFALYDAGARVDGSATLTAPAPSSGSLSDLLDGSTASAVAWTRDVYAQSNFAIVWDLGTASRVNQIAIGTGNSKFVSLESGLLQSSDDNANWSNTSANYEGITAISGFSGVLFPAALTLTDLIGGDPLWASVAVAANFDATNPGTSYTDGKGNVYGFIGTASIVVGGDGNPARRNIVRPSSGVAGSGINVPVPPGHPLYALGTQDWTVDWWAHHLTDAGNESGGGNYMVNLFGGYLYLNAAFTADVFGGQLRWSLNSNLSHAPDIKAYPQLGSFPKNQWNHVEMGRQGNTFRIFLNGILRDTATSTLPIAPSVNGVPGLGIGCGAWSSTGIPREVFNGYMSDVRVTVGVCRHSANFTPNVLAPMEIYQGAVATGAPQITIDYSRQQSAYANVGQFPPAGVRCRTLDAAHTVYDAEHGGNGFMAGTVKTKADPDNIPVRRRVVLFRSRGDLPVRETWSAPDGTFAFTHLNRAYEYDVVAYDYQQNYRAVIADRVTPKVMA